MKPFLREVAERIMNEHPNDMERVAVVFNNRRPSTFLAHKMAELSNRPMFLPTMLGMNDLVAQLSGLTIIQSEFLLFELYDVHCHIPETTHRGDTFEDFISFGDIMLSDFSEIDLYCIDAAKLFDNLHDLKKIGEWDIEGTTLTEFQKHYLDFYKSLYTYYTRLRKRLQEQGKAYSGSRR